MSDVEARREARRRKILENSEKRLHRITGVQQRNASYELEGYRSAQNIEDENHSENHVHNSINSIDSNHLSPQLETIYRNPLLNPSLQEATSVTSINKLSYTETYKVWIIVGIAFIVNLLLLFIQGDDFILLNKIFIPLLCFEGIHLFYNQNNDSINGITNVLRLVCRNIPPHHLSLIVRYLTLGVTLTRDVMIYFFVFVCIWFILKVLQGLLFF